MTRESNQRLADEGVLADLQRQPHLMLKLAENALTVAENLRDNYFRNTAKFVEHLRQRIHVTPDDDADALLKIARADDIDWRTLRGELVTFIDGGIGNIKLASQVPILLRVGSYLVRTGDRHLAERERFGYYPVILGDLEGGSKERKDFPDIVRITAELLGGLSVLEQTRDLSVLMLHGPLVYMMSGYSGHTPFTEKDIDLFLEHYGANPEHGRQLKDEFLEMARLDLYPKMTNRSDEWVARRLFEPLAWIAFLCRRLIRLAKKRTPTPIIAGVVERGGTLRNFSETVLLEKVYRRLRERNNQEYFNEMYGRKDLNSPKTLLDRLGYTDSLLLAMLLRTGEYSEPWEMKYKYAGFRTVGLSLPGESHEERVDFSVLAQHQVGYPIIKGFYLCVSESVEPIRVEVFSDLGSEQVLGAARRGFLYARLLPEYGFPVGLHIADKHAKVPTWMTEAYARLIRHHLGVSLQKGQITDAELRRILVQAIYMTHRDWLFRPKI